MANTSGTIERQYPAGDGMTDPPCLHSDQGEPGMSLGYRFDIVLRGRAAD